MPCPCWLRGSRQPSPLPRRQLAQVPQVNPDVPDAKDDGSNDGYGRLVPDAKKDKGRDRQARYGNGYGTEGLVHTIKPLSALEVADPGELVEEHEKEGGNQPEEPREREALRTDEHEGRDAGEHLADTLEREEDLALMA